MKTFNQSCLAAAILTAACAFIQQSAAEPTPGYQVELAASLNPLNNHLNVPREWANVRGSLGGYYFSEPAFETPNRFISTGIPPVTYYSTSTSNSPPNSGSFGTWPAGLAGATGASGNEPDIRLDGDFSIELWLRRRGLRGGGGGDHQLIAIGRDLTVFAQLFLIDLYSQFGNGQDDGASLDIWFRDEGGDVFDVHDDVLVLPLRTDSDPFDHLVVTYDEVADQVQLYLNNVLTNTIAVIKPGGYTMDNSIPMVYTSIFKTSPVEGDGRAFNGDISTFRFYDTILTPNQIASNFVFGAEVPAPPAPGFEIEVVEVNDVKAFRFMSEAGLDYELQKSATGQPADFLSTGAFTRGDGTEQFLYDPAGFAAGAAYRVVKARL